MVSSIIVTAYFNIVSKFSHEFYMEHIRRFLPHISVPVIFFTTPDLVHEFSNLNSNITFITYENVHEIEAFKKYGKDFWIRHTELDNQYNYIRSPELAAIWYNKKEFVKRAMKETDHDGPFIWCDVGCVRLDDWIPYIKDFGKKVEKVPKDKLLIQLLYDLPDCEPVLLTHGSQHVAAAIISGYREIWLKCSDLYDEILEKFNESNVPAAMDQDVWGSTIMKYPHMFETIKPIESPDKWFFFLIYL